MPATNPSEAPQNQESPQDRPLFSGLFQPKPAEAPASPQKNSSEEPAPPWLAWLRPRSTAPAGPTSAPAPIEVAPDLSPFGSARASDNRFVVVSVRFDILRVRVNRGVFSASGKVWNHLDQQVIPAETAALLDKNGMRVGIGGPDSWPPIQAMLEHEPKIETSKASLTLANGLPLTINVNQGKYRDETLFLFRPDQTLAGVSSPASTNLIRIEYMMAVTSPGAVQIDVMPQIQQRPARGALRINELGELDEPIEEPVRVLRELAFRLVVNPERFLAMGPSERASQGHLAGSLMFCEEIEGKPYESMYFITPRLQRSDQKPAP